MIHIRELIIRTTNEFLEVKGLRDCWVAYLLSREGVGLYYSDSEWSRRLIYHGNLNQWKEFLELAEKVNDAYMAGQATVDIR